MVTVDQRRRFKADRVCAPYGVDEYGGINPTCPDVLIRWPRAVLTVKSKFTEHWLPSGHPPQKRAVVSGRSPDDAHHPSRLNKV
jgi:hypothetical protein